MQIKQALNYATCELKNQKEARILLSAFLNKPHEWLFTHEEQTLTDFQSFKKWIAKRLNNEPLEYITQKVSFYSREFFIQNGVLIPRPETELLVDLALEQIKNIKNPRILEIGTGSGIISIMLAILCENIDIIATDINEKAIHLAKKNAKKFGVSEQIDFIHTNLDENITGQFDLLVSNPPYISTNEKLQAHVLKEPHEALFSGIDGSKMLKELVLIAKKRGIKTLCCEMGHDQKNLMKNFLQLQNAKDYEFYRDLSGLDRGFVAKF